MIVPASATPPCGCRLFRLPRPGRTGPVLSVARTLICCLTVLPLAERMGVAAVAADPASRPPPPAPVQQLHVPSLPGRAAAPLQALSLLPMPCAWLVASGRPVPPPLWRLSAIAGAQPLSRVTVGTLPPGFRQDTPPDGPPEALRDGCYCIEAEPGPARRATFAIRGGLPRPTCDAWGSVVLPFPPGAFDVFRFGQRRMQRESWQVAPDGAVAARAAATNAAARPLLGTLRYLGASDEALRLLVADQDAPEIPDLLRTSEVDLRWGRSPAHAYRLRWLGRRTALVGALLHPHSRRGATPPGEALVLLAAPGDPALAGEAIAGGCGDIDGDARCDPVVVVLAGPTERSLELGANVFLSTGGPGAVRVRLETANALTVLRAQLGWQIRSGGRPGEPMRRAPAVRWSVRFGRSLVSLDVRGTADRARRYELRWSAEKLRMRRVDLRI